MLAALALPLGSETATGFAGRPLLLAATLIAAALFAFCNLLKFPPWQWLALPMGFAGASEGLFPFGRRRT